MKCPKCGKVIPEEFTACSHCGEKVDYLWMGGPSFGGAVVKLHKKSERKKND